MAVQEAVGWADVTRGGRYKVACLPERGTWRKGFHLPSGLHSGGPPSQPPELITHTELLNTMNELHNSEPAPKVHEIYICIQFTPHRHRNINGHRGCDRGKCSQPQPVLFKICFLPIPHSKKQTKKYPNTCFKGSGSDEQWTNSGRLTPFC